MASTPAVLAASQFLTSAGLQRRWWAGPDRRSTLLAGDVVVAAATTLAIGALLPDAAGAAKLVWSAVLFTVWLALASALNAYELILTPHSGGLVQRAAVATGLGMVATGAVTVVWSPFDVARWPMAIEALALFAALFAWRVLGSLVLTQPPFRTRVLMLGAGARYRGAQTMLRDRTARGYEFVGTIPRARGGREAAQQADDLMRSVDRKQVRMIVVDGEYSWHPRVQSALLELAERGVVVTSFCDFYESLSGRSLLSANTFGSAASTRHPRLYGDLQRLADLTVAALGLLLSAPVLTVAAIAIVLDSRGAPLFRQERVGRYGRPFRMVKLRTMCRDAEADHQPVWASGSDPRVTRVGALLRCCHLDELPQLWNVLVGEMSVIGPRPERPEFVRLLAARLPFYAARHVVRPGITGWAQVQFKYAASISEATTKLQYDLFYIRHRNPVLDGVILLKTLSVVLRRTGI